MKMRTKKINPEFGLLFISRLRIVPVILVIREFYYLPDVKDRFFCKVKAVMCGYYYPAIISQFHGKALHIGVT